jgi:hypothetical protein
MIRAEEYLTTCLIDDDRLTGTAQGTRIQKGAQYLALAVIGIAEPTGQVKPIEVGVA